MGVGGRVLVVEDEVLIRMLAVDMLLDLEREADEAGSAAEALTLLNAPGASYALVLLDLGLPDKHGDDLVREIPDASRPSARGRERGGSVRGKAAARALRADPFSWQTLRS